MELKTTIVYAGEQEKSSFYFFILEDLQIKKQLIYSKKLFDEIYIGYCYQVEFENEFISFKKNQKPVFMDFENKIELISKWKSLELACKSKYKEQKKIKDIHRFEEFKFFKSWFKTQDSRTKQIIVGDLINFLNN